MGCRVLPRLIMDILENENYMKYRQELFASLGKEPPPIQQKKEVEFKKKVCGENQTFSMIVNKNKANVYQADIGY